MNTKPLLFFLITAALVLPVNWCSAATLPQEPSKARDPGSPPEGLSAPDWTSIRAAHDAWRHAFRPQADGTHTARNHAQQWRMTFDGRGFTAQPMDSGWQWGLELIEYAVGGEQWTVEGKKEVRAKDNRLSVTHDATLEEWFINDGRGLEQGWTFHEPPAADDGENETLCLTLAVHGSLQARGEGAAVSFTDEHGATVLTYGGLKAWDADGKPLPARMTSATHAAATENGKPKTENTLTVEVDARGARYPVTIDPIAQQAYLKPAAVGTTQAGDQFGWSVAVSGDTVVVGALYEDSSSTGINSTPNESAASSGAAYIFVRTGTTWSQQAYLKPKAVGTSQAGDQFGISVAISGNTVVVGANREDSSSTGVNSVPNDTGGSNFDSGAAYVFVRSGTTWSQQAYLKPASVPAGTTQAGDTFGDSVAISGDTVIVGAGRESSSSIGVNSTPNENAASAGAAYIFTRSGTTWRQQAYLKPAAVGSSQTSDAFGSRVAISGDTVVVGALGEDSSSTGVNSSPNESAPDSGAAYVFVRSGAVWSQHAYLKPAAVGTTQAGDTFGSSVGISGDTVIVGAMGEDSSTTGINSTPNESSFESGAAYVFVRGGPTWIQQAYLKPGTVGTTQSDDLFGISVAISGDTAVVGAIGEDSSTTGIDSFPNESAAASGAAYVFVRYGTYWSFPTYLKPAVVGNSQSGDSFGWSVAVSGDTVIVGALYEGSGSTGVNSTPNEGASGSGTAYIFRGLGPVLRSFSRSGAPVPDLADVRFSTPGSASVNAQGDVMFDQALLGLGTFGGLNRGIFSNLRDGVTVDAAFFNGTPLAGLDGFVLGSKAVALARPLCNQPDAGLFLVTAGGTGVTSTSNKALFKDDGNAVSLLLRTGMSVTELGGAQPSAFHDIVQNNGSNLIAISMRLKLSTAPPVTATNDSGLLMLNHAGTLTDATPPREGADTDPDFGTEDGKLGQFTGRAANGLNSRVHFGAMFIPTAGIPVPALFMTNSSGTATSRVAKAGMIANGTGQATFASFPALSHMNAHALFRATLKGAATTANEGIWRDSGVGLVKLVLKGEDLGGGVRIARILKFWPVDAGGVGQIMLQVTLTGPGVTLANNSALLLRQSSGSYLVLLRTGDRAPGAGPAKVRKFQAVDVDPLNGHYAVLGSLSGAPASSNQALWAGQTTMGNDSTRQLERLPTLRLRKGDRYMSFETPLGTIRSLSFKPAVDPTGAGGRGLAQTVGSGGHVMVYILTDGSVTELVRLKL